MKMTFEGLVGTRLKETPKKTSDFVPIARRCNAMLIDDGQSQSYYSTA